MAGTGWPPRLCLRGRSLSSFVQQQHSCQDRHAESEDYCSSAHEQQQRLRLCWSTMRQMVPIRRIAALEAQLTGMHWTGKQ